MEGLTKAAIEKIEEMAVAAHKKENAVIKIGKNEYWVEGKSIIVDDPRHARIDVNSLSAIVTFIKDNREGFKKEDLFIHVRSPYEVRLFQKAGERNIRTFIMSAGLDNDVKPFPFERFMSTEEFIIGIMSRFEDMGERPDLVSIAGSLRSERSIQNDDDGATTRYEAKHGVVSLSNVKIPDVVELYPFRTFRQVEQPGSIFIFRYRADEDGSIKVGLFEADGGAWKHVAMSSIEGYFKAALPEVQVIA